MAPTLRHYREMIVRVNVMEISYGLHLFKHLKTTITLSNKAHIWKELQYSIIFELQNITHEKNDEMHIHGKFE